MRRVKGYTVGWGACPNDAVGQAAHQQHSVIGNKWWLIPTLPITVMPEYRRVKDGRTYFFTVITYKRQKFLCLKESREVLEEVIKEIRIANPFVIRAWVLMPDHLHCIWTLPENDVDYSKRWGLIKSRYTKIVGKRLAMKYQSTSSRKSKKEATVWQRRFWEHKIRNEKDYENHCNYIHYNPVKHGLASSPGDWKFSTFHRYVNNGTYLEDWGSEKPIGLPKGIGGE